MLRNWVRFVGCLLIICCALYPVMFAQQASSGAGTAVVPLLINYSGTLTNSNGKPLTGTVGVTFSLYQDQESGSPLWVETQNVQLDKAGHYSVQLGATSSQGLPPILFAAGQARWLGVQAQGEAEQPRALLMSVPYALKALDAETIGGKPASSFMLAPAAGNNSAGSPPSPNTNITGSGTTDFLPLFTGTTTIGNSKVYQTPSGDIGIGTTSPAATLDVKGKSDIRDTLTLFPKSTDPALKLNGSAFQVSNTGTVTFVSSQTFPGTGTVTSVGSGAGLTGGPITGSGTLSVATGGVTNPMLQNSNITLNANSAGGVTAPGAMTLGSTYTIGLKPCSASQILEYSGSAWTCVNVPGGTITGVTAGTDLTGGGTTGNVTLNVDTTKVPQLAASNGFTASNSFTAVNYFSSLQNFQGNGEGAISAEDSGSGFAAIGGVEYATNGGSVGVFGSTMDPTGAGVEGWNTTGGMAVYGYAANLPGGTGTYGVVGSPSGTYDASAATGVWGDTNATQGVAVAGSALEGFAGYFVNDSSEFATLTALNAAPSYDTAYALSAGSSVTYDTCSVDIHGNLECTGSKSAVVPVDGGSRKVALYAMEAPENWFEDFGSGQLSNGSVQIGLEPTFAQTVNTDLEYHVFLTPNGDCKGLYVSQKSPTSFEVHELGGGTSNVAFDYRIIAKRKNYEAVRLADLTEQYKRLEEQIATMRQRSHAARRAAPNSAPPLGPKPSVNPMRDKQSRPTQSAALPLSSGK